MEQAIILALLLVALILWVVSTRRRLAALEENAGNAMHQIGVQLDSCFEALTALVRATGGQAEADALESKRETITAQSSPEDVRRVVGFMYEALGRANAAEGDSDSVKYKGVLESYRTMVRTSYTIYNAAADKLNESLARFPTALVAGALGFHRRALILM